MSFFQVFGRNYLIRIGSKKYHLSNCSHLSAAWIIPDWLQHVNLLVYSIFILKIGFLNPLLLLLPFHKFDCGNLIYFLCLKFLCIGIVGHNCLLFQNLIWFRAYFNLFEKILVERSIYKINFNLKLCKFFFLLLDSMGKAKNEILDHFTSYAIQVTFFLIKLFY